MSADFSAWMRAVDREVERLSGMGIADLPDWHFRDAFDEDVPPEAAAAEVLEEAGF